ncbi:MAG: hypothetical protein NTW49_00090 [Bacteroidia bacterium]|nr:hypothetical protein [Bacteroidia bacterium]
MKSLIEKTGKETCFRLSNGKELYNIAELSGEIPLMEDHVFYHHVSDYHNDFANWIRDVYEQKALANKVVKANSKVKLAEILEDALVKEEQKKSVSTNTKKTPTKR